MAKLWNKIVGSPKGKPQPPIDLAGLMSSIKAGKKKGKSKDIESSSADMMSDKKMMKKCKGCKKGK